MCKKLQIKGGKKMRYMGDTNWWDERFKVRDLKRMTHEKCLEEDISHLVQRGNVLDVACGDGRNAIYLAKLGYDVEAIDFSKEALRRLEYFAEKESLNIKTRLCDLSSKDIWCSLDKYDLIIVNHYRLSPELCEGLIECLNRGGILWVNGFREVPKDHPHITDADLLYEEDFVNLRSAQLESKQLYDKDERKFVKYIWRKS